MPVSYTRNHGVIEGYDINPRVNLLYKIIKSIPKKYVVVDTVETIDPYIKQILRKKDKLYIRVLMNELDNGAIIRAGAFVFCKIRDSESYSVYHRSPRKNP